MKNVFLLLFFLSNTAMFAQDIFVYDDFLPYVRRLNVTNQTFQEITPTGVTADFSGLAIDDASQEFYITTSNASGIGESGIYKADINGNTLATLATSTTSKYASINLDKQNGFIYYRTGNKGIERRTTEGMDRTTIYFSAPADIRDLVYNENDDKIYFTNKKGIYSISSDGVLLDTIYIDSNSFAFFTAISLAPENNELYIAKNIDGIKTIQKIIIGDNEPTEIVTIESGDVIERIVYNKFDKKIYWSKSSSGIIEKINPDGTNREVAVDPDNYGIPENQIRTWEGFAFYDASSSIHTELPALEFTIYPNPSSGKVSIKTPDFFRGTLRIINPSGILMRQYHINNNKSIEPMLKQGLYFLEIIDDKTGRSGIQRLMVVE